MFLSLCILGRQPALGLAELESLFGADNVQPINQAALVATSPKDIPFHRLGGTIKLCKVLTELDTTDWKKLIAYIEKTIPEHLSYITEGKIKLGLSVYGMNINVHEINRSGLAIKKVVKREGRSIRIIPNTTPELNSAQVIHNNLTGPNGLELVFVKNGDKTILAQTTNIQDIEAYAARDQARPKRDAKVGMLPPKLAQIIVNLAGSHTLSTTGAPPTSEDNKKSRSVHPGSAYLVDPFCGTGVILQEALLMGYEVFGTDLEPRMIEYSQTNLEWLTKFHTVAGSFHLAQGDATTHHWEKMDLIACETYLGRPFSAMPDRNVLEEVMRDVDTIHRKFLKNVTKQTQPGFRMCLAVPAWNTPHGFKHLKMLDSLEELGYTRQSFVHVRNQDLVYHREGQIVGRELVVITRK
jgi:tRNA G10  N-methylase Trm11